jgi:hypothetical protein
MKVMDLGTTSGYVKVQGLRRSEDDHYLATVDDHGVITLTPAVPVPTPKEK